MYITLLAEHYDPLIGGGTHLTKRIAQGIAGYDDSKVRLVVTNSGTKDVCTERSGHIDVVKLGIGVDIRDRRGWKGGRRVRYAKRVDAYLKQCSDPVDLIHILTGNYLLRFVDVEHFQGLGIPVVANVVNVPPEECAHSWPGDVVHRFAADAIRKWLVKLVNRHRITHNEFDAYTTISSHSMRQLNNILPGRNVHIIPLGCDSATDYERAENSHGVASILTVAGVNPSKNLLVIPDIAADLRKRDEDFRWHVIGPNRNERYFNEFKRRLDRTPIKDFVEFIPGLPRDEILAFYANADIYVQPSVEEGFCMTALDAILFGLPLVGLDTGAIAEFVTKGSGVLVTTNSASAFANAIVECMAQGEGTDAACRMTTPQRCQELVQEFSWENNAAKHHALYEELIGSNG